MKAIIVLICTILLVYSGCKKDSNPVSPDGGGENNKIQTGEMVDLAAQSAGAAGGTIKINKPGDKLNGMEIIIPPNAFTESKTFKISSAEIKSHQLGQYINPISPLIKISYDGGYAEDLIEVKVPVKVPKGYFAMAFFYDENTGKLEGLPVIQLDSTSVTVCTRHFSTSTMSSGNAQKSLFKKNDLSCFSNMIISSIKETILSGQPVISTGYELNKDDWEFPNYGSYISPGGHCAGQSISSMWYYYEKKLHGAPFLYGQFDDYDNIWADNPKGYRFASTIQEDISFTGLLYRYLIKYEVNPLYHLYGWDAFAYSMLVTGEPQFVGVSKPDTGHALVAYKISLLDGLLYVADPNFPGQVRTIKFQNGHFLPYSSKQNAAQIDNTAFPYIGYYSKTCMIDWNKISSRWNEFENGTIGNDRFPAYQLVNVRKSTELKDGFYTDEYIVEVECKSTQCLQAIPGSDHCQLLYINDDKGNYVALGDTLSLGVAAINLKLGVNKFGFHIMGARNNRGGNFVDFKWINIIKDTVAIDPVILNGQPNKEYTFTARTFGTAPKPYKMVWNFGDNSPAVTVNNDSTAKHTFTSLNSFTVNVSLRNQANEEVGEAISFADITASPISIISTAANGEPILVTGAPNKEYTFIAKTNGQTPKNGKARFVWNYGDNTPDETIMNDSLTTHTFTKGGNFTINVKVYDDTKLIVEGNASVKIKSTAQIDILPADPYGEPILNAGTVNKEYTFIGDTKGTAPRPYKMTWNFGDSTPEVTVSNDSTVKHTFTSANQFPINVKLFNQVNVKLAEDNTIADIRTANFYVSSIKPDYGVWGDTVKIKGTGFGNIKGSNSVVFKNEKTASVILWSDTLIKVIVPNGTVSGNLSVTVGGKTSSNFHFTCYGSMIDSVKTKKYMSCYLTASFNYSDGSTSYKTIGISLDIPPVTGFTWQGNSLKFEKQSKSGRSEVNYKIIGTFDDKGLMLISLKLEYSLIYYESETSSKINNKWESGFTVNKIGNNQPFTKYIMVNMEEIKNHITEAYDRYQDEFSSRNSTSLDWTSQSSKYASFGLYFFNQ